MNVKSFTEHPGVYHTISDLQRYWEDERVQVSDVVDEEGHQYVDLVMEGGGVLGIALLGYSYALEQVGIRFLGIGGTSAGSINALLLAAVREKHLPKSEILIGELANKDFYDFVDGGPRVRRCIEVALNGPGWIRGAMHFLRVRPMLWSKLGLNPGDAFHDWISGILDTSGITDTASLINRISAMPPGGFRRRSGEALAEGELNPRLALIAAEVSTETKVEFPRMASLFWEDPDRTNPADFVRASMSIPGFFQPFRVQDIPATGTSVLNRWKELAGYKNKIPDVCYFIDGGIMSNFPIDVFHRPNKVPLAPTFGAKLGEDNRYQRIEGPGSLAGAIFNSARHCLDYDFVTRNPDYRQLVTNIDTGHHHWLNFRLTDAEKLDLFHCGVRSAAHFLRTFNWPKYKEMRQHLADAHVTATAQQTPKQPSPSAPEAVPMPGIVREPRADVGSVG